MIITMTNMITRNLTINVIRLRITLTLLVTRLTLNCNRRIINPITTRHNTNLYRPFILILRIIRQIKRTIRHIIVLQRITSRRFLMTNVNIIIRQNLSREVSRRKLYNRQLLGRNRQIVVKIRFFCGLTLFRATRRLVFGKVTTIIINILRRLASRTTILEIGTIINILILFFPTNRLLRFLVTIINILVKRGSMLQLYKVNYGTKVVHVRTRHVVGERTIIHRNNIPILQFTFLVTTRRLLFVTNDNILILRLTTRVVNHFNGTRTIRLPIRRRTNNGHRYRRRHDVTSNTLIIPARLFLVFFRGVPRSSWASLISRQRTKRKPCPRGGLTCSLAFFRATGRATTTIGKNNPVIARCRVPIFQRLVKGFSITFTRDGFVCVKLVRHLTIRDSRAILIRFSRVAKRTSSTLRRGLILPMGSTGITNLRITTLSRRGSIPILRDKIRTITKSLRRQRGRNNRRRNGNHSRRRHMSHTTRRPRVATTMNRAFTLYFRLYYK